MTLSPQREVSDLVWDKLQEPEIATAVAGLLDHAELLAVLLEGLDQLLARSETVGESLLDGVTELRTTVQGNAALSSTLEELDVVGLAASAQRLASSDVLNPKAVDSVGTLARGLVAGTERFETEPVEVTGVLSLTRLLKDPDIRRALSYGATIAKSIGQQIQVEAATRSER